MLTLYRYCRYFEYRIGFGKWSYSHPSGWTGRNVIIFGADMSLSVYVDNNRKHILIFEKGPKERLSEKSSAEKMYLIKFTKTNTRFCLSLH